MHRCAAGLLRSFGSRLRAIAWRAVCSLVICSLLGSPLAAIPALAAGAAPRAAAHNAPQADDFPPPPLPSAIGEPLE